MEIDNRWRILGYVAIVGNLIYIFWILHNGLNEGLSGATLVQIISFVGLLILLAIDAVLLSRCP